MDWFKVLQKEIVECGKCPRLREYCAQVAITKRRAYRDEEYWGRPVPSFGDPRARLLIVGLAPAAHGANRTGRMFTGDRSGDFLYRVLHAAGFASQPTSRAHNDGLKLRDAYITASAHCAPPDNKPSREELNTCRGYLVRELAAMPRVKVVVALGRIALENYLRAAGLRPGAFHFGHGVEHPLAGGKTLICSYHPSQQNTSTGRLTEPMFQTIFDRARQIISPARSTPHGQSRR